MCNIEVETSSLDITFYMIFCCDIFFIEPLKLLLLQNECFKALKSPE